MLDAALLHVFALHAAVVISPGPNFVVVAHAAATESRPAGLWTATGVALGAVAWALAATLGFAAVTGAAPELYTPIRLAGSAYLVWVAVILWRGSSRRHAVTYAIAATRTSALARGLGTNLANPKSIVFFGSVLSVALPTDASAALRLGAVAIIGLNAIAWYGAVAVFLGRQSLRARYDRHRAVIDRTVSVVMLVLAVRVVLT